MADTIAELTDDQKLRLAYSKRMRTHRQIELTVDQLYALAFITLSNAVVPGDYPTLKTNIEAVTGVQNVELLVDHHTLASLPADTKLVVNVSIDLDIQDVPTPP